MAAVTTTLCCTLLFVGVIVFVSGEQKTITAESGQNVTLTCGAPNNSYNILIHVSVIRKDVTINDTGKYECRVAWKEPNQESTHLTLLSSINLSVVVPPGPGGTTGDGGKKDGGKEGERKEDGSVGPIVGLLFAALLLVAVAGFVIYRAHTQSQDPYLPPVELQPA